MKNAKWWEGLIYTAFLLLISRKVFAQEITTTALLERAQKLTANEANPLTRKLKIDMLMNTPSFRQETD